MLSNVDCVDHWEHATRVNQGFSKGWSNNDIFPENADSQKKLYDWFETPQMNNLIKNPYLQKVNLLMQSLNGKKTEVIVCRCLVVTFTPTHYATFVILFIEFCLVIHLNNPQLSSMLNNL